MGGENCTNQKQEETERLAGCLSSAELQLPNTTNLEDEAENSGPEQDPKQLVAGNCTCLQVGFNISCEAAGGEGKERERSRGWAWCGCFTTGPQTDGEERDGGREKACHTQAQIHRCIDTHLGRGKRCS